ncbi:hypothetical protein V497_00257, partial [Pseudogymnoascus sp. VKM F-4516 (FW-969)]
PGESPSGASQGALIRECQCSLSKRWRAAHGSIAGERWRTAHGSIAGKAGGKEAESRAINNGEDTAADYCRSQIAIQTVADDFVRRRWRVIGWRVGGLEDDWVEVEDNWVEVEDNWVEDWRITGWRIGGYLGGGLEGGGGG